MRILPILFNTDMVRALLEGRKTVTRRVIKGADAGWEFRGLDWDPAVFNVRADGEACPKTVKGLYATFEADPGVWFPIFRAPYEVGDVLYVREAWYKSDFGYEYRATYNDLELKGWKPSIHMPKEAARIFLRVKDVRAERLQGSFFAPISPIFELRSEGMDIGDGCRECIDTYGEPCCVDTVDEDGSDLYGGECGILDEVREKFSEFWDSTVKPTDRDKYGWSANPWVWVIELERVDRPVGWLGVKKNGA